MSTRSDDSNTTTHHSTPGRAAPHPSDGPRPRTSTERAFVIQFDPVRSPRSRLRGRVEVVASGDATHFRSLKELLAFIVGALRR